MIILVSILSLHQNLELFSIFSTLSSSFYVLCKRLILVSLQVLLLYTPAIWWDLFDLGSKD